MNIRRKKIFNYLTREYWESTNAGEYPLKNAQMIFKLLFGVDPSTQIEISKNTVARYLPIFRLYCPTIRWPEEFLVEPEQWSESFSTLNRNISDGIDMSLHYFTDALDGIFVGCQYKNSEKQYLFVHEMITKSITYAISNSISGIAVHEWNCDDPLAKTLPPYSMIKERRRFIDNIAAINRSRKEWCNVLELIQQKDICAYPDITTESVIDEMLISWEKREMVIPTLNEIPGDYLT